LDKKLIFARLIKFQKATTRKEVLNQKIKEEKFWMSREVQLQRYLVVRRRSIQDRKNGFPESKNYILGVMGKLP